MPEREVFFDVSDPECDRELNAILRLVEESGWALQPSGQGVIAVCAPDGRDMGVEIHRSARDPLPTPQMLVKPDKATVLNALGLCDLENSLVRSIPPGHRVDKVVIGFNWTMVRSGELCGIARSPARGTEGARTIRPPEGFVGMDLSEVARFLISLDPLARSLGLAAINCFWNRVEPPDQVKPFLSKRGGLASIEAPGNNALIIGGFRGALDRLPNAKIIEREPKPGDIPARDAPAAFKTAKTLSITAQTLMNGSLAPILAASGGVPFRNLVGPSCPACPLLLGHGLDEVFGAVILDPEAAENFILESGTMIMLDSVATTRTLRAGHK